LAAHTVHDLVRTSLRPRELIFALAGVSKAVATAAKKVVSPKIELYHATPTIHAGTQKIRSGAAEPAGRPSERHGPNDVLGANLVGKE
jgi:hypothetical protein